MGDLPNSVEEDDPASDFKPKCFEVTDEPPPERIRSARSAFTAATLLTVLNSFVRSRGLGYVFDCSTEFRLSDFPTYPNPDVSFIARGRFGSEGVPVGAITIAPDLTVIVVSPTDPYDEVEVRIQTYFRQKTRLVWIVMPTLCRVLVRRADQTGQSLDADDQLDGEDVVPGFSCPVAELFA